jgi:hypothetical protein
MLDSTLHARLGGTSARMPAHELEVLGHVVHFLPFHIGDDDVDVVTTVIMHPP